MLAPKTLFTFSKQRHSNFSQFNHKTINDKTFQFIAQKQQIIFSATKYNDIKSLNRKPFEMPYLKNSSYPEMPYLHPQSPYVNEFPDGVIPKIKIEDLRDNPGAKHHKNVVGRGIGCRKGKTSGRGFKGQKSRSDGGTRPGFEGGVPFYKRVRKFGFSNALFKKQFTPLNLDRLQYFFDSGRLIQPTDRPINMRDLRVAGVLTNLKKPVKLLGEGKVWFKGPKDVPFNIEVSAVSKDAKQAIEDNGGKVTTVYFNKLGLRQFLRKPLDDIKIRFAKCVKKPEQYDMPRFIRYSERSEEDENEVVENENEELEEENQ